MFEEEGLDSPEALLASSRLLIRSLDRFKKDAEDFRARAGDEAVRQFASEELNDMIYDIQDAVPVAVRLFNSLMREADDAEKGKSE